VSLEDADTEDESGDNPATAAFPLGDAAVEVRPAAAAAARDDDTDDIGIEMTLPSRISQARFGQPISRGLFSGHFFELKKKKGKCVFQKRYGGQVRISFELWRARAYFF